MTDKLGVRLASLQDSLIQTWQTAGPEATWDQLLSIPDADLRALVMAHTGAAVR